VEAGLPFTLVVLVEIVAPSHGRKCTQWQR